MAKKIWKYLVEPEKTRLPEGAEIMKVGSQGGFIYVWALIDEALKDTKEDRYITVFGTNWPIEPLEFGERKYLDTVFINEFVWHVFEEVF